MLKDRSIHDMASILKEKAERVENESTKFIFKK